MAKAFTLIELIAVIVVLAILAGVATPAYFNHTNNAKRAAATYARATLAQAIHDYKLQSLLLTGTAQYPADLDGILDEAGTESCLNPYRAAGQPIYEVDNAPAKKWYMQIKIIKTAAASKTIKTVKTGAAGKTIKTGAASKWSAIWYNPNNGSVRFRIPDQGSSAKTIELFNEVNAANITSLSQTSR